MSKSLVISTLMASALFLAGCQTPTSPVQPEGSPAPGEIDFSNRLPAPRSTLSDVPFETVNGGTLKLDVRYPAMTSEKMPAMVYVHSGGWYQGDKNEIDSGFYGAIRDAMLNRGVVVVSINYRLAPWKFPSQVEDVRAALAFLADETGRFAIDPERVALVGTSSGGHLAALAGLMSPEETPEGQTPIRHRPKAVASLYGVLDLEAAASPDFSKQFHRLAYLIAQASGTYIGTASPILTQNSPTAFASADDPPIWLTHGDADNLVPLAQSQALHQRMTAAGGQSTLVTVQGGGHGYKPDAKTVPSSPEVVTQLETFLAKHLAL